MKIFQNSIKVALVASVLCASVYAKEGDTSKAEKAYASAPISRYAVPKPSEYPEDIQKIANMFKKKLGFVPNIVSALAHHPKELKAFIDYNVAFNTRKSGITKVEKEMFLVATSAANGCQYCVVYHGAMLRLATKNPFMSDQVAINYKEADITPRQRAIIDFAMKVSFDSKSIGKEDFEKLYKFGLNDEDIWDITGITALYNLSNRLMNVLKVRPDEEFYKMGR